MARVFYQDHPCDHFSFSALVPHILLELYLIFCLCELDGLLHSVVRYPLLQSCIIILLNYALLYIISNNLSIPSPQDGQMHLKSGIGPDRILIGFMLVTKKRTSLRALLQKADYADVKVINGYMKFK